MRFFASFLFLFALFAAILLPTSVSAFPSLDEFLVPPSVGNSTSGGPSTPFRFCATRNDPNGQFGDWGYYNSATGDFSFSNFPHNNFVVGASFTASVYFSGQSPAVSQYNVPGCCVGVTSGLVCYFPAAGPVHEGLMKPIRLNSPDVTVVQLLQN